MLKRINHLLDKDEGLLKHSSILFIAGMIGNVLNYFFHFFMGRMLGPAEYGIFGALLSLTYIIAIPGSTILTVVTRYTSKFYEKSKEVTGKVIKEILRKVVIGASLAFIAYLALTPFIADFLKINKLAPVAVLGFVVFFQFVNPVFIGSMRGLQRFRDMGIAQILNACLKLLSGIVLVSIGFAAGGALLAFAFGLIAATIYGLFSIRDLLALDSSETIILWRS